MDQLITRQVPGIKDNVHFEAWIRETCGITIDKNLKIETSDLGGAGLFFDAFSDFDEDVVLARIPKVSIFDYETLLRILEKLKSINIVTDHTSASEIVVNVLKNLKPTTETDILICYFIGFAICLNNKDNICIQQLDILQPIEPYLSLLMDTKVHYFEKGSFYEDSFLSRLRAIYDYDFQNYSKLEGIDSSSSLSFQQYRQLASAVRSRVLEIPHNSDLSNEAPEEEFYTNISLVPLLDFANHLHSRKCNSYFDIDRTSNEVLLKLKHDKIKPGRQEITISYAPTEFIPDFIKTYGFLPLDVGEFQLLEIEIPHSLCDELINDIKKTDNLPYGKMMKWLNIVPSFQLVKKGAEIYINFFSTRLPLIFLDNLRYEENWKENAFNVLKHTNPEIDREEFDKRIYPILELQESQYDIIDGFDNVAVKLEGSYYTQEQLLEIPSRNDVIFNDLISSCTELILRYTKIVKDGTDTTKFQPSISSDLSEQLSIQYYNCKIAFCKALQERSSNNNNLSLPVELAEADWEENYKSKAYKLFLYD